QHNSLVNFEAVASGLPKHLGRRAFLLLGVAFTALLTVSAGDKTQPSISFTARSEPVYISALAAANRFLQAWQNQDHETGLLMLTDDAKQHSSEEHMEMFFSSSSSGGIDGAYEIARGKKIKAGRYVFPVRLFPVHSDTTRF